MAVKCLITLDPGFTLQILCHSPGWGQGCGLRPWPDSRCLWWSFQVCHFHQGCRSRWPVASSWGSQQSWNQLPGVNFM